MTAEALLTSLRARNVTLWVIDEKLRYRSPAGVITPDVREQLMTHKAELINLLVHEEGEIGWRVRAMRSQVPASGPIPFLVARQMRSRPGRCESCGDPPRDTALIRCTFCALAARLVLSEPQAGRPAQ